MVDTAASTKRTTKWMLESATRPITPLYFRRSLSFQLQGVLQKCFWCSCHFCSEKTGSLMYVFMKLRFPTRSERGLVWYKNTAAESESLLVFALVRVNCIASPPPHSSMLCVFLPVHTPVANLLLPPFQGSAQRTTTYASSSRQREIASREATSSTLATTVNDINLVTVIGDLLASQPRPLPLGRRTLPHQYKHLRCPIYTLLLRALT